MLFFSLHVIISLNNFVERLIAVRCFFGTPFSAIM
nr:MAG TPA: hypothetical protein [Caudoviricetes sp.]